MMLFSKKGYLFIVLLSLGSVLYAQEIKIREYNVDFKKGGGFIIAHNPLMQYFAKQHIDRYQLSFEKNSFGDNSWQELYGYPRIGFSISYFKLNNPAILGNGITLSPHFNFALLQGKRIRLGLVTSIGVGYLEKRFHVVENFKNAAIGSRINVHFNVSITSEIKLGQKVGMITGINFSHFSNNSIKTPNLGLNLASADIGLYYNLGELKKRNLERHEELVNKKAFWNLNLGAGVSENYPPGGKKFISKAISVNREKKLNRTSSIAAGLDFYYNPAIIEALENDSIYIDKGWDNAQLGVSIYHVLHFNRIENYIQMGYYLKTNDEDIGNIYHIFGGRYMVTEGLRVFVGIKTHFAKAEYLMWGINIKPSLFKK